MPTRRNQKEPVELLENLLIVELAKAGVSQAAIREIVGVDMARVNKIARFFKRKNQQVQRSNHQT
jgi:hypothetical protein